jgi:leader peptidase (prepilin peptidase)/N-methyltransferase
MVIVIVIVLGLITGSFLNVVIFRLNTGKSFLFGRSFCLNCKKELKSRDLIPILSFLYLKGRCRYCKIKLSWQYPIVELATALSFAAAYSYKLSATSYIFICIFIVIAVYDFKHYLILDKVVLPASLLALFFQIWQGNFLWPLLGALIVAGFFAVQYLASKGKWIGFGDVKLGILLGLIFAQNSLWFLLLAYFVGALIGIFLILFAGKQLKSRIPFGTILGFSAIIFILYGEFFISWYLSLLGL